MNGTARVHMCCSACGLTGTVTVPARRVNECPTDYRQMVRDQVAAWHDRVRGECGDQRDVWFQEVFK